MQSNAMDTGGVTTVSSGGSINYFPVQKWAQGLP
jgi:hypothetical protein